MTLEEMRKRKKQLGLSNMELSDRTGIPAGTLNKILSGATRKPSPENMEALEKVLLETSYQYGHNEVSASMVEERRMLYGLPPKRPGEYTIEDYYKIPDDYRVELLNGVFYDMASPTVVHQLLAGSVYSQILNYIRGKKGKCIPMISPIDVKLDSDNKTMVQPDVIIVCDRDRIHERIIEGGPDFVMEVVSPSSIKMDYIRKASKYLDCGVREYWIADPMKETMTIFDFSSENPGPKIVPLSGKVPVGIYGGDLLIDLDEYKELLAF